MCDLIVAAVSHLQHRLDLPERVAVHSTHAFRGERHCEDTIGDVGHVKIVTCDEHPPSLLGHQIAYVVLPEAPDQLAPDKMNIHVAVGAFLPILRHLHPHFTTLTSSAQAKTCLCANNHACMKSRIKIQEYQNACN